MSIEVTPFIFLLNMLSALTMPIIFIRYTAHERITIKPVRLDILDTINISVTVMLTSLYTMWSLGCLIGSYSGVYRIFMYPMGPSYNNLLVMEILIDIFMKGISLLSLSVISLQMKCTEVLRPWGICCGIISIIQGICMCCMMVIFKGTYGWVILYMLSSILSCGIIIFSVLTGIIIRGYVGRDNVSNYMYNNISIWSMRICHMILVGSILDLMYKMGMILMEVNLLRKYQVLIDLLSLGKAVSVLVAVISAYSARIPKGKAYAG
ncbi:uncharacterized protein NESG_01772 [Nematocida ausubeli]|uniref:Uncharacterized protein n=1 Tax=Nematocida ausubeli (strain ATCC PRA-371 / ERTm2) TaxID=1913371 RepID=A0A086J0X0_NEMA1|nr:uncharacterized protein NESG_01772 [Nematocida ausubeli]KFG25788.1 hypothetical protein NESG_01772 [Nematocida ausubeli]